MKTKETEKRLIRYLYIVVGKLNERVREKVECIVDILAFYLRLHI